MVDLQRASAGSGKTYALTRYFLRFLIAVKEEDGHYRLRKAAEIPSALGQILAITFTNKATNEMQMRIVEKLDALAQYRPGPDQKKWPDYMKDFTEELHATPQEVRDAAVVALKTLLNNYSDFNVLTIDAFFQSVLRTFAYESNLADSYQVELESKYVSRMGLNSVLDDVDSEVKDRDIRETRRWLKLIMDNEPGHKWNVFQKSDGGRWGDTPYSSLLGKFSNIDTEDYREKRDELDTYLDSGVDLYQLYADIENEFRDRRRKTFARVTATAHKLTSLIVSDAYREGRGDVARPYRTAAKILTECRYDKPPKVTFPAEKVWSGGPVSKEARQFPDLWRDIKGLTLRMEEEYRQWEATFQDPWGKLWGALRVSFPFLGLLKAVSRKRREYLAENDSIELGETSLILNAIIGPSDTPFVYERMGNYLSHLLVDEFQDTSSLQWRNLRPLVLESLANGNDNLIIGDAKQSIYRFRNADYELINSKVPYELEGSVNIKGNTPGENTNWRSDRRIVEWNNNLFHYIISNLHDAVERDDTAKEALSRKLGSLYCDVKQAIHKKERGYVELILANKPEKGAVVDRPAVERQALDLILDALDRGYEPKDICILARDNVSGTLMVQALMDYNMEHPGAEQLQFVSEQSLLVGNSTAVRQVEIVLRTVARGVKPEVRDEEARRRYGVGNIHELESHLLLYHQMHPDMTMSQCMESFMKEDIDLGAIRDMLDGMQSLALPALVEAVISSFVSRSVRQAGAPYLAAFQDAVLEYCDGHPADLPSFLTWWDRVKLTRSISSPEDANAIRIMTSHKSKGLEFPVVIVTNPLSVGTRLGDYVSGKEWVWVSKEDLRIPDPDIEKRFPPYIPVNITKSLEGTSLQDILYMNYELETIDSLNLLYVTFTRAKNELYIFASQPSRQEKGCKSVYDLLMDFVGYEECNPDNPEKDFDPCALVTELNEEKATVVVSYGDKLVEKYVEKKDECDEKPSGPAKRELTDYPSIMVGDKVKMRQVSLPDYNDDADDGGDEEDSSNPRSTGNVCHAVMEGVKSFADLPREIRRVEVSGIVPDGSEVMKELRAHVAPGMNPVVDRWFGGASCRVVNERAVLKLDETLRRPDRIMIYDDGSVEIVDYKFGHRTAESDRRYRRQVENYVRLMKQAGYERVIGWLWYVFEPDPSRHLLEASH